MFLSLVSTRGKKILEIGCGQGYFSAILAPEAEQLTITDISATDIKMALDILAIYDQRVQAYQASGQDLSRFTASSFDLVVFPYSLHHNNNPGLALDEAWRVLKIGGEVAVIEPRHRGDYCQFLAPFYSEEEKLASADQALKKFICSRKTSREYSVDWCFESISDLRQLLVCSFNLSAEVLNKTLASFPASGKIIMKDLAIIWLLKK